MRRAARRQGSADDGGYDMIQESLELRGICKSFGGIHALQDINFKMTAGRIYGLAGENGAGKSTTMKIINGAYQPDEGEILLDGIPAHFASPLDAQRAGIGMVYQELNMLPDLNVAENIFISHLSDNRGGYINWDRLHKRAHDLLRLLEIDVDTHTKLGNLRVAYQQLIAIVRALSYDCKVIILDEPTSALTDKDGKQVIKTVRKLKELGYIVIYISHKLQEVLDVTDEIIVFRNGVKIGDYETSTLTEPALAELIAGRKLETKFPKKKFSRGEELLRFEHVSVEGRVNDVSFSLHKGEILGIAGLLGAGKTEVAKALFGVFGRGHPKFSGDIYLHGKKLKCRSPGEAIRSKIGLVPEDRAQEGLITSMSIYDNILMVSLGKISRFGWMNVKKGRKTADEMVRKLEIKCGRIEQPVNDLSRGNQQKAVLAKWMALCAELIVFDEPTRGIDVGAKVAFYELMNDLVESGVGVIIMSSELEEVKSMSDSLVVLREGQISATFDSDQVQLPDIQEYL